MTLSGLKRLALSLIFLAVYMRLINQVPHASISHHSRPTLRNHHPDDIQARLQKEDADDPVPLHTSSVESWSGLQPE